MTPLPIERLASLHITSLSPHLTPSGSASACILSFSKKNLLLTVAHATGDHQPWGIAVRYVAGKGVETYRLGGMNFIARIPLESGADEAEEVDFSYVEVPKSLQPLDEEISATGMIIHTHPKGILPGSVISPSTDESYAFYGYTRPQLVGATLCITPKHETGLKFAGEENDLLRFNYRAAYQDYAEYKGCSGAPILDAQGRLVSLVVQASGDRKAIYGLNLRRYWAPVLIEAGEFQSMGATAPA